MLNISRINLKLILVQFGIFLVFGEIGTRLVFGGTNRKTIHYGTIIPDQQKGWISKPNYSFKDSIPDSRGKEYGVEYQSEAFGFRKFGKITEDSLVKVFFIGDSFTQAAEVSDEFTFYQIIQDSLPIEVFAFGTSGYGTFQEYLVYKEYYEKIKPEIVIWQLCSNDFIDNYFELELQCDYQIRQRRPYYEKTGIQYKNTTGLVRRFLLDNSTLFFQIDRLIKKTKRKLKFFKSGEWQIANKGKEYGLFRKSIEVTNSIFKKIKEETDETTKIIMFCSDSYEPQLSVYRELAKQNEIEFLDNNLENLSARNKINHSYDGFIT